MEASVEHSALTFGLIEGGVQSFHAPLIQAAFGVALICFVAFLFIEVRGYAPMLPPRLFANSTISVGLLAGAVLNFVYSGLLFVLSLFFQQVRSYSPLLAGLAFLPLTLVLTINPTFTGRLVGRFGARIPLTLGFFLAASGVLMQIWTNAHTSYAVTLVALVLMGGGFSLAFPALTVAVMAAAPKDLAGIASGALNSSRQVGAALGVAVLGAILNGSPTFLEGMHRVLLVAGIALVSGGFFVLSFVRRTERARSP